MSHSQAHPQPEAQDEVLQGQGASDLILCVEEPQEQGFLLSLQPGGELLLVLFCLVHSVCQDGAWGDVLLIGCDVAEVQIFQSVSHMCRLLFNDTQYHRKQK